MNHSPHQDPALLAAARARFAGDRYATKATGCEIAAVAPGYARCRMTITPVHRNALGIVMGGAIFTLADFTFAVASNTGFPDTVSVDATIHYLAAARGDSLTAESVAEKNGRRSCVYRIVITDAAGTHVADVTITGMRVGASSAPSQAMPRQKSNRP
jgi:acyl-CoA thioesterase